MISRQTKVGGTPRISACVLSAILLVTGLSYGEGQIEKGSTLAKSIESRKKVFIATPEGEKSLLWPVVLDEGIASRTAAGSEKRSDTGYDKASLIPWVSVNTVEWHKTGGGVGAGLGLGAGAVFGYLLEAGLSNGFTGESPAGGRLIGAIAIGGACGALFGYLIGSKSSRRMILYTAPSSSRPRLGIALVPAPRRGMAFSFSLTF